MSLIERRRFLSGATAFQFLAAASDLLAAWLAIGARAPLIIAKVLALRAIGFPPCGQQLDAHQLARQSVSGPCYRECISYQCNLVPLP